MRTRILLIALSFMVMSTFAGEHIVKGPETKEVLVKPEPEPDEIWIAADGESLKEKQKRIDIILKYMTNSDPVLPIARGPHVQLGKAAVWVIDHFNRLDGGSMTGWAKFKVSDDLKRYSRFKIGIINGELDSALYHELEDSNLPRHDLLKRWELRRHHDLVFGVSWSFHF